MDRIRGIAGLLCRHAGRRAVRMVAVGSKHAVVITSNGARGLVRVRVEMVVPTDSPSGQHQGHARDGTMAQRQQLLLCIRQRRWGIRATAWAR